MNKKPNIVRSESFEKKINALVLQVAQDRLAELASSGSDCEANRANCKTFAKWGKSWVRIDIGRDEHNCSGYLMVDANGNIHGIKAYGVPHLGHHYGTLDTLDKWTFNGYTYATRKTPENTPPLTPAIPDHVKLGVPDHTPSPIPNLIRFYFWNMDGTQRDMFNHDGVVRGFVQSVNALNAKQALDDVKADGINCGAEWALARERSTGIEFQMTWRNR
jgi:hypothetical protein